MIQRTIEPTARVLEHTRQLSMQTIYLQMGFQPDLSDAGPADSPNRLKHAVFGIGTETTAPDGRKSRVLVRDTWNTDIVDELRPAAGELTIYKTRYSGFYGTELDSVLRDRGITHLLVTGCTTSVCVESTIRDARVRPTLSLISCMSWRRARRFARLSRPRRAPASERANVTVGRERIAHAGTRSRPLFLFPGTPSHRSIAVQSIRHRATWTPSGTRTAAGLTTSRDAHVPSECRSRPKASS